MLATVIFFFKDDDEVVIKRSPSIALEQMQNNPRPRIISNHFHHQTKKFGRTEGFAIGPTTSGSMNHNTTTVTSAEIAEIETVL